MGCLSFGAVLGGFRFQRYELQLFECECRQQFSPMQKYKDKGLATWQKIKIPKGAGRETERSE